MSVIDEVLQANRVYAQTHELRRLTPRPERKLAILTCMDTRLSIRTLGLKTGDAHIIRNAGGITIGQDEATSAVYGMPRSCAEHGVLQKILPLPLIAEELLAVLEAGVKV